MAMTLDEQARHSKARWTNRRRMAWTCMVASLVYPILLIAQVDGAALAQIAMPFYLFTSSVVGAYIGFATLDDKNMQNYMARKQDEAEHA